MVCKNCGFQMADNERFCPNCGMENIPQPNNVRQDGMYCSNCGMEVFPGEKCCPNCGTPVPNPAAYTVGAAGNNNYADNVNNNGGYGYNGPGGGMPAPPKEKSNTAVIIVAIVAGVVAVLGILTIIFWDQISGMFSGPSSASDVSVSVSTPAPAEQTAEVSTEAPTEENDDEYDLDSRRVTYSELDGMSEDEIQRLLNEMYAYHGFIFEKQDNIDYFSQKSWYNPRTSDQDAILREFNSIEMDNRKTITDYQYEHGWRSSRV